MNKNFHSINLKEIKQNQLYIFGEICLFGLNIYRFVTQNDISIVLLLILLVIIIAHVLSFWKSKRNEKNIPDELKFMVEFAKSIGYTNTKKISEFTDFSSNIDLIRKVYEVDGINVRMQKEYIGRVSSKSSDGIKIMTCGGSSTSSDNINANTYYYDYKNKKYKNTRHKLINEDERCKIIKIYFKRTLGEGEKFKIKYVEKQWDGAMRMNYDGIVIGEQLFFDILKEQNVIIKFKNIKNLRCELFQYNYKKNEISKMNCNIFLKNNSCSCSIKEKDIDKDCILFFMYRYDMP